MTELTFELKSSEITILTRSKLLSQRILNKVCQTMASVRMSQRLQKTKRAGKDLVPVIKKIDSKRFSPPITRSRTTLESNTEPLNHRVLQDTLCKLKATSSQISLENISTNKSTRSTSRKATEENENVGTAKRRKRALLEDRDKSRSYKRRKKISKDSNVVEGGCHVEAFDAPSRNDQLTALCGDNEIMTERRSNIECGDDFDSPIISHDLKGTVVSAGSTHAIQHSLELSSNCRKICLLKSHNLTPHSTGISSVNLSTECIHQTCTSTEPEASLSHSQCTSLSFEEDTLRTSEPSSTPSSEDMTELTNVEKETEYPQPSTPKQKMARRLARQRQLKEMRAREAAFEREQRLLQRKGLLNRHVAVEDVDGNKRKRISWKEECDLVQVFVYSPTLGEIEGESSLDVLPT